MPADDTTLNAGSGGETIRSLATAAGISFPVGVSAYPTTTAPAANVLQIVDLAHGLPVQPMTSATWAASQSGTWTVGVSGSVAVTGTFFQATQPVSAASLPLPSGAATSAKQDTGNNLLASAIVSAILSPPVPATGSVQIGGYDGGNDVTRRLLCDANGVLSVGDGGGSLTVDGTVTAFQGGTWAVTDGGGSLTVDGTVSVSGLVPGVSATSLGKAEDAAAADGDTGVMALAIRKDTAATTTGADGDYHPLEVDGNGRLWVNGSGVTQPVSGTVAFSNSTIAVTNAGTFAVQAAQSGTYTVGLSAAQTLATVTTVGTVTNLSQLGGTAVAMNTGVRAAGVQRVTICTDDVVPASQSGTWTVQPGNTANTTPWLTTQTPATSGGCSAYSVISSGAANQDSAAVKGSAGQLYGYALFNTVASIRYVKLYNKASGATSGDTPVVRIMLPASGGANMPVGDSGVAFGTGICVRITTGAADNDAGACSANDVLANVFYK